MATTKDAHTVTALMDALRFNWQAGFKPFAGEAQRYAVVRGGRCHVLPITELTEPELDWIASLITAAGERHARMADLMRRDPAALSAEDLAWSRAVLGDEAAA